LTNKLDSSVFIAAKNGCQKSKRLIVEQWSPLVYKISHKMYQSPRPGVSMEDVYQEGFIGLLKAIETNDGNSSSFMTWAYYQIKGKVSSFTRKQFRHAQYPVNIEDADRDYNLEDGTQTLEVKDSLPSDLIDTLIRECAGGEKTKRAQIVRDRFGLGTEQLDTAQCVEKYGINRFAVSAHCTAFKAKVRAKFPELAEFA
jgi:RNA polymerase sigma factor (sigma-70 family)